MERFLTLGHCLLFYHPLATYSLSAGMCCPLSFPTYHWSCLLWVWFI